MVARSQEGTGGDPQKTEKHTALKAAPTPNTTANMPCQAALPEASFSGGRRDGAAGREEERCHPADASHDPPPCHSPLRIPVHPKLPGPQLGRGGHLQRAPMFLETPVSPRADREPGPPPSPPRAHAGTPQTREASPLHWPGGAPRSRHGSRQRQGRGTARLLTRASCYYLPARLNLP